MPLGTGTFHNTQSKMRIIISQHQQDIFNETYTKGKETDMKVWRDIRYRIEYAGILIPREMGDFKSRLLHFTAGQRR